VFDFHLGILEVGDETEMEEAGDCVSQGVHAGYEGLSIHHKVQEDFSAKKKIFKSLLKKKLLWYPT
jgi:hypothetical protein